jgi:hypothetical protein
MSSWNGAQLNTGTPLPFTTPDISALSKHGLKENEVVQCKGNGCSFLSYYSRTYQWGEQHFIYERSWSLEWKWGK